MGNIWTKEQEEKVKQLDADFETAVAEKGIKRNSKDAADFWRSGGFQKRMAEIFGKEYEKYDVGGPIPSDLQSKIADYKKRVLNPLLPASAVAKLNDIIAGMEAELAKAETAVVATDTNTDYSNDADVKKMEVLETRLKLLKKMVAKKPTATLKTRIKIVEKMLNNVAFGKEFMDSTDKGAKKTYADDSAYERLVDIANENNLDEDDKNKIKKEDVAKLVAVGYTIPQLETIYFGYKYNHLVAGDNELSSIGGFMSYRDEAIEGQIKSLIESQEKSEFELGLKYPDFNWNAIVKKYGISPKPQIIEKEHVYPDGDNDTYIYEIYVGKGVVIGHSIGRKRFKKGKLEETIMNDNEVGDFSKAKKTDKADKPGFNGGYWGVASSKIEVIDDISKMLTSQKDSYVKDLDMYVNGLGGVTPDVLKANNVKFEEGGVVGCGCKHFLKAAEGTKIDDSEGVDLFEDPDSIPKNIQKILEKYEDDFIDGNYTGLAKALKEVQAKGYTFEYYLDGQAYDLRKIGQKGKTEVENENS